MSVLRLLAVFIVTALFTGCDLGDDLQTLKADIAALRTYVISLPVNNLCEIGTESSRVCTFQLKITDDADKASHLYIGTTDPDLYKKDPEVCKKASHKDKRRKGYDKLPWDCDDYNGDDKPYPGQDTEFAFYVDNDTDIKKGGAYLFKNVPYKTHLKKVQDCPCIVKTASQ
jgi:hypothetical protein